MNISKNSICYMQFYCFYSRNVVCKLTTNKILLAMINYRWVCMYRVKCVNTIHVQFVHSYYTLPTSSVWEGYCSRVSWFVGDALSHFEWLVLNNWMLLRILSFWRDSWWCLLSCIFVLEFRSCFVSGVGGKMCFNFPLVSEAYWNYY